MARTGGTWRGGLGSRQVLALAALILFIHAMLPPATTAKWTRLLRAPLEIAVQPVQRPIDLLAARLRKPAVVPVSDDPRVAQLQNELELYKVIFQQKLDEISRLQRQIQDLQQGLRLSPDLPVVQIPATVVGPGTDHSSSVLKVRAGRRKGITPYNAVAVVQGVYLVGRVAGAAAPFFDVVPITDRRAPIIRGVIMLEDVTRGPTCALEPQGDGTLKGDVQYTEGTIDPPPIKPGMTVRLMDDGWPQHAQGLVIGRVEKVENKPTQTLRPVVTVRPQIRIDRVTEVVLRVLGEVTDEEPASPPTGGSGAKP